MGGSNTCLHLLAHSNIVHGKLLRTTTGCVSIHVSVHVCVSFMHMHVSACACFDAAKETVLDPFGSAKHTAQHPL